MIKFYEMRIDKTYKKAGNKGNWQRYDQEKKYFGTIAEAKQYIAETYSGHKKVKMFRNGKNGKIEQAGWIYSYKSYDWEDGTKYHFTEAHWVELLETNQSNVLF
jgi:hypothetical protein